MAKTRFLKKHQNNKFLKIFSHHYIIRELRSDGEKKGEKR